MLSKTETDVDMEQAMLDYPGLKQFNEWLANKMLENWMANEQAYIKMYFSEYVAKELKNIRGYYKEWCQMSFDFKPEKNM